MLNTSPAPGWASISGTAGASCDASTMRPAASITWMTVVRPSVASNVGSISFNGSPTRCVLNEAARAAAPSSAADCRECRSNHINATAANASATISTSTAAKAERTRTPQQAHHRGSSRTLTPVILPAPEHRGGGGGGARRRPPPTPGPARSGPFWSPCWTLSVSAAPGASAVSPASGVSTAPGASAVSPGVGASADGELVAAGGGAVVVAAFATPAPIPPNANTPNAAAASLFLTAILKSFRLRPARLTALATTLSATTCKSAEGT